LPLLVVEVEVDPELAKQRVAQRKQEGGHGPSDDTFTRFINDYRSFSDEGFTTVSINGQDDVAVSVAKVKKALHDLWQQ
jgi:thymidylate kinase